MRVDEDDINATAGGLLRDLATVQTSDHKMFGYKRAAAAVLNLEEPLSSYVQRHGSVLDISGIGPASARVIHEVLATGNSETVESAITQSGRRGEIDGRRALRRHFLSRAKVVAVLDDRSLTGVGIGDVHADLHMHSEWSDGAPTLDELTRECRARGYLFAAVTDHSHGLAIARGMTTAEVEAQHAEIDRINRFHAPSFRLLKGVEANIGADGLLDLSEDEAAVFELIIASPHSRLRRTEDQTPRMLAAVANPHVRMLGHPRGRIREMRNGVVADWTRVFEAAAEAGVAIELDGDPARQDLDYGLAARARAAGCIFALDSDAHAIDQLRYAETAVAHARLAGIPREAIVNCWDIDRLQAWLVDRMTEANPVTSLAETGPVLPLLGGETTAG